MRANTPDTLRACPAAGMPRRCRGGAVSEVPRRCFRGGAAEVPRRCRALLAAGGRLFRRLTSFRCARWGCCRALGRGVKTRHLTLGSVRRRRLASRRRPKCQVTSLTPDGDDRSGAAAEVPGTSRGGWAPLPAAHVVPMCQVGLLPRARPGGQDSPLDTWERATPPTRLTAASQVSSDESRPPMATIGAVLPVPAEVRCLPAEVLPWSCCRRAAAADVLLLPRSLTPLDP